MSQYSEEGIVDVEKRTKEVGQILGDPTLFPVDFLSWLKRYIEQSGITLPASSIIGGFSSGSGKVSNLAAGLIIPFGGAAAPSGSLACDGTTYVRNDYPKLFAEIDVLWGAPDGLTFNVPDLRGRALYGAGGALVLGVVDAIALSNRGPTHKHTVNEVAHGHTVGATRLDPGYSYPNGNVQYPISGSTYQATNRDAATNKTNLTVGPQTAGTPVDAPAHAVITYIITTGQ